MKVKICTNDQKFSCILQVAGIAIALQDLFKNIAGVAILFLTGLYRVGDRIEINSKTGDVMEIGILYATILEIKDWVSGGKPLVDF